MNKLQTNRRPTKSFKVIYQFMPFKIQTHYNYTYTWIYLSSQNTNFKIYIQTYPSLRANTHIHTWKAKYLNSNSEYLSPIFSNFKLLTWYNQICLSFSIKRGQLHRYACLGNIHQRVICPSPEVSEITQEECVN